MQKCNTNLKPSCPAKLFIHFTHLKGHSSRDQEDRKKAQPCFYLPFVLWLVNYQEHLKLLGRLSNALLNQSCWCCRLLHYIGDGTEEARAGWSSLGPAVRCWRDRRSSRRRSGGCSRTRRRGRSLLRGGTGWRWWRRIRPLQISHVAIGQVGNEAAVRKAASQEVHSCGWWRLNLGGD